VIKKNDIDKTQRLKQSNKSIFAGRLEVLRAKVAFYRTVVGMKERVIKASKSLALLI